MLRALISIHLLLFLWVAGSAQSKNTHAVKVSRSPKIDGDLDEDVWRNAPAASDFITNTPIFGQEASYSTTVKVLYDNTAIYIGAMLYCNPKEIRKQFTS